MSDTNVHRVVGNLLVGSSHFFVDTTNNKVGINTSSPSASLEIATGDLKVGSGITLASGGTITAANFSGNGSGLTQVNSDQGSWVNGASSNIHLAVSTDNVGIGTEDPACALDIAGEDVMIRGSTPSLNFSEGTNGMDGAFRIHYDGANQNDGNNFLAIQHGTNFADTSLHCTLTGRVGIGTSSPDTKLHLYATGSGNVLDFKMSGSWSSGDYYRIIGFNADKQIQFSYNDGMWLSDNNSIRFGCGGTKATSGVYSERMRITNGGNVGIGTTSPGAKLHVDGGELRVTNADSAVAQISAYGSSQGTGRLYVGQSAQYGGGIEYNGDNVPTSTGAGADYITLYRVNNSAYNWTARNLYNSNDWEFRGFVKAAYNVNVASYFGRAAIGYCGFNDYMSVSHIDSNSTSGYALLQHSNGFTYLNCQSGQGIAFRIANGDYMRMNSSGNFGVGTTGPSEKLHVNGNIRLERSDGNAYLRSDGTWWRNYSGNGAGIHLTGGAVMPTNSDGNWPSTPSLGHPTYKWGQIYSTSSSISNSDRTTKQDINEITESEKKVAAKMVNLFRTYRVKDAVEKKGEKARVHSGVVAQDLIEAFQSEGLDAHRYGLFCYDDVWMVDGKDELFETVYMKNGDKNFVDENGVQREYTADDEGVEEVKEGTGIFADKDTPGAVATPGLYSIRYEELLCFVVGGVLKDLQTTEAKLRDLETTKADLETTKTQLQAVSEQNQKLEARLAFLESALIS